jgi:hypothetical protein
MSTNVVSKKYMVIVEVVLSHHINRFLKAAVCVGTIH